MAQQPQRENSGVLFKNADKKESNHPDYKGQINVGGKQFWLSAWIKTGVKGKFMSLAVKEQQPRAGTPQRDVRDHREYDGDEPIF